MLDLQEEARWLQSNGVTLQQIRNEIKQRQIEPVELREFGIAVVTFPGEEQSLLAKYSDKQLKEIEEAVVMRDAAEEFVLENA